MEGAVRVSGPMDILGQSELTPCGIFHDHVEFFSPQEFAEMGETLFSKPLVTGIDTLSPEHTFRQV